MKNILLLSVLLLFKLPAWAIEFSAETCKNQALITREIIELELAGQTWQGGNSPCLKQENFKTVIAKKEILGDSYLLEPEYILAKGKEIKVVSETLEDSGYFQIVSVKISYTGIKNKKEAEVQDGFSYQINYGKNRSSGCAMVIEPFKKFVMKEECYY